MIFNNAQWDYILVHERCNSFSDFFGMQRNAVSRGSCLRLTVFADRVFGRCHCGSFTLFYLIFAQLIYGVALVKLVFVIIAVNLKWCQTSAWRLGGAFSGPSLVSYVARSYCTKSQSQASNWSQGLYWIIELFMHWTESENWLFKHSPNKSIC